MKQSDGQNRDSKRFLKGLLIVLILAIIFKYLFEHWMVPTLLAGVSAAGPFIIGLVIAYLMRFAVNPLERLLMKLLRKKEPKRWIRVTAAAVSLLVLLGAAVGLLCGIVPSIYYNIVDLLSVLPEYLESIGTWIDELLAHSNVELSQSAAEMLRDGLSKLGNGIVENLSEYVAVAGNVIISVGVSVFNVLIGILVAFYVLMDSPRYARLGNRALRALISDERRYQSAKAFIAETDTVMGKYINGKLIETFAVGVICFLGFLILGAPYDLLMSVIVALMNLVPYVGPVLGAVPVVVLSLLESPQQAIWIIGFLVLLQVLDNYVIGPKIIGNMLKVSPLWILVGVIIGGGMFGLPGMLLGVPAMALLSGLFNRFTQWREQQRVQKNEEAGAAEKPQEKE